MTNKNKVFLEPTKTLWGVSTSISFVRDFFDTKGQAIDSVLDGREQFDAHLPSIVDITKYDYYKELDEFNDVISVQGLKNWSNKIPHFKVFRDFDNGDIKHFKLNRIGASSYGLKIPEDEFAEAAFYYLDYIAPHPVPTSWFTYDGTLIDDIYKSFECPRVTSSEPFEVRCYKEIPLEKTKKLKL